MMKAVLTALIAAIEAAAVALAGLAVVAVPALLMWWLTFSLSAEPSELFDTVSGVWLLAHFVPLTFEISAETALALGLAPDPFLFTISLAPLGLTVLTVTLAFRSGWRFTERGGAGIAGVVGGMAGFAAVTGALVIFGESQSRWATWAVILLPACCYGAAAAVGFAMRAVKLEHAWWLSLTRATLRRLEWLGELRVAVIPARMAESLRLYAGALAAVIGLGALGIVVAVVVGYIEIVTVNQSLQLDFLGLVVLFLLYLALLPVAVIWAIAWFSGAGFALGAGTSVTPFETLLGPLPALPLFGAIPNGWGWAGALAPAIVVLIGVAVGALAGGRSEMRRSTLTSCILMPIVAAALVGLTAAGLSALAAGAIGPGRLAETGPQPWLVGGLIALELAIGLVFGVLARRLDTTTQLLAAKKQLERLRPGRAWAGGESEHGRENEHGRESEYGREIEGERVAGQPLNDQQLTVDPLDRVLGRVDAQMPPTHTPTLASAETVELEPVDSRAEQTAATGAGAHSDAQDVASVSGAREEEEEVRSESSDSRSASGDENVGTAPEEVERDELLDAFSWESPNSSTADDQPSGWRPPWRRR